jgi:Sec-independent protein secretion pathway components
MFGIGWSELIVIFCVIIIFARPKDIPPFFRLLGKTYARRKKDYEEIVSMKDDFVWSLENSVTKLSAGIGR